MIPVFRNSVLGPVDVHPVFLGVLVVMRLPLAGCTVALLKKHVAQEEILDSVLINSEK